MTNATYTQHLRSLIPWKIYSWTADTIYP